MPTLKQRLLALLATGRVANIPTVATHVGVGFLLYWFKEGLPAGIDSLSEMEMGLPILVILSIIASLGGMFYVGGCLLGDAADASFDTEHRPERPIPQGTLSARGVAVTGSLLIGTAWMLSCIAPTAIIIYYFEAPLSVVMAAIPSGDIMELISPVHLAITTTLTLAILTYAKYHKRFGSRATILMAICRVLLILWAASIARALDFYALTQGYDLLFPSAAILSYAAATFVYTLCLSLVARNEADPNAKLPSLHLKLLFILPPIILSWLIVIRSSIDASQILISGAATAVFLAWTLFSYSRLKHSIPAFVSAALAGFCLMDACFAALIGWPFAVACVILFLLALLLQRIAPAT